jgi:hypothetical protein
MVLVSLPFPSGIFPLRFPAKILNAFLTPSMRNACSFLKRVAYFGGVYMDISPVKTTAAFLIIP